MLIVTSNSVKEAYTQTLNRLIFESNKFEDSELFREDVGVINIKELKDNLNYVSLNKGRLIDSFPYTKCFPHITSGLVQQEMIYWNNQFMEKNGLRDIIEYLRSFPMSKRGIILFWDDKYRDLSKGAVCEIAVFFRIKNGKLEMHSHMRANNASFLLFMDMCILIGVQRIIANELGIGMGEYFHFIDSLHIYEAERDAAMEQSKFVKFADEWNQY